MCECNSNIEDFFFLRHLETINGTPLDTDQVEHGLTFDDQVGTDLNFFFFNVITNKYMI